MQSIVLEHREAKSRETDQGNLVLLMRMRLEGVGTEQRTKQVLVELMEDISCKEGIVRITHD